MVKNQFCIKELTSNRPKTPIGLQIAHNNKEQVTIDLLFVLRKKQIATHLPTFDSYEERGCDAPRLSSQEFKSYFKKADVEPCSNYWGTGIGYD